MTVESLQAFLLSHIFVRVVVSARRRAIDISMQLLVLSLSLSLINLTKAWVSAYSRPVRRPPLLEYAAQQVQMGKGVPLDAIKADAIEEVDISGQNLEPQQVQILAAVLETNSSVTRLVMKGDRVFQEEDAAVKAIGKALVARR